MKKILIFFAFTIITLMFSATYILATDTGVQNDAMKATDGVRNVVGGAENVVEDTAKDGANGIKNGINTVGNDTGNTNNNGQNNGTANTNDGTTNSDAYTATRTATNGDVGTNGVMDNAWTWIIVAIIAIVIIAVIWYYSTRSNDND